MHRIILATTNKGDAIFDPFLGTGTTATLGVFDNDFSYTSIDIYRDLHCWELLFHWIPTGYQRSYTLTIRVKSDILKDLKLERRKDWIAPEFN